MGATCAAVSMMRVPMTDADRLSVIEAELRQRAAKLATPQRLVEREAVRQAKVKLIGWLRRRIEQLRRQTVRKVKAN